LWHGSHRLSDSSVMIRPQPPRVVSQSSHPVHRQRSLAINPPNEMSLSDDILPKLKDLDILHIVLPRPLRPLLAHADDAVKRTWGIVLPSMSYDDGRRGGLRGGPILGGYSRGRKGLGEWVVVFLKRTHASPRRPLPRDCRPPSGRLKPVAIRRAHHAKLYRDRYIK
jgi:hypothetical protein